MSRVEAAGMRRIMILLIDNYDSFSYNLFQIVGALEPDIRVVRNDELGVDEIRDMTPSHIILSPGPGRPADAGICEEVVLKLGADVPILGVCLGHLAICEAYGATVTYAKELMHGKSSVISLDTSCPIFDGLPGRVQGARYHSLAVLKETLPGELRAVAGSDDGEVMAVAHRSLPVYGLQFHPESILTPDGAAMMKNFISAERKNI
jgi:anthranilate synthase component 2